jgi:hypothetical protein
MRPFWYAKPLKPKEVLNRASSKQPLDAFFSTNRFRKCLGYVDREGEERFAYEVSFLVRKKQLADIIDRCIRSHGTANNG